MLRTQTNPPVKRPVSLKNYSETGYSVSTVNLEFNLSADKTIVKSTVQYERRKGTKPGTSLKLDGDGLVFISVALNGATLSEKDFSVTPDLLVFHNPPKTFELEIVTQVNPTTNTALSGLYRSSGNYCTQCEAEGFRRITYFYDRPDVLAVYTVRLEAHRDDAPLLLANGNPIKKGRLKNNRHFAVWHDPHPKPSYLFALVGGDLGSVHKNYETSEGRKVKLGIYVEKGKEGRAHYAMDALIRSMRWDEEVFGCAYDLDVFNIVAVSDFNMGAMENKGLNIFNDKYVLADENTANDVDYSRIEAIIAHEYFHNWTGNRITCRDWFQLCLKEGLTVYRDQEFSSDMRSRAVKRIESVVALRAQQFPEDAGPLAHSVRPDEYMEINNFYTATIYEKGAEIVRMLATLLGPKKFAKGIQRYLTKHDGDAATVEDFIKCFEVAARVDLSQFFLWYTQAGTPHLHFSSEYNESKQTFTVEIEQSLATTPGQNRKKLMHIPLHMGLVGSNSQEDIKPSKITGMDQHGDVYELTQRRHKIIFHGVRERPVLSINRGFSTPVEIDYRYSDKELNLLASSDSDAFNRWQAFRTAATRQILSAMKAMGQQKKPKWSKAFIESTINIATNETLEPAFRAMMLTMPTENELAQIVRRNIDPEAIYSARKSLIAEMGEQLLPYCSQIETSLKPSEKFSPDAISAGKRKLANLLLGYRLAANDSKAEKFVVQQFNTATNMSDREAALSMILREIDDGKKVQRALTFFYKQIKDDPIVLDKWFMIQAMQSGKSSLNIVKELTGHKDFSWTNPNRMRSLIGVFAQGNPTGFNRADGEGYKFIAKAVFKLDKINPQVAARLLTSFRSWRSLEPKRKKHAQNALDNLRNKKNLSTDVSDILGRMLS